MADYIPPNLQYILGTSIILVLPTLYYLALPRVLPGIPHHKHSAHSIKGDIPAFIAHTKATSEISSFFARQCFELKSPLVQTFLLPFSKTSYLILSDYREIKDIATRRTHEFDRSEQTTTFLESLVPHGSIQMKSHEIFKAQRRLWAPTMSTAFLNDAAASHIRHNVLDLLALWRRKADLSRGTPFQADDDLGYLTFDAIWAIALGDQLKVTKMRTEILDDPNAVTGVHSPTEHVIFSSPDPPPIVHAVEHLLDCVGGIATSLFPRVYQMFMRRRAWYRRDWAVKENTMAKLIKDCRQAFENKDDADLDGPSSSAMELVLKREHQQLLKSRMKRDPEDRHIKDELFTFLIAGHETTTTTLSWFVKFMTNHQETQTRLRQALQKCFPDATSKDLPSAEALATADCPYLDAVVAESLRVSRTAGGMVREALVDTEILGYRVPAGTSVFCVSTGVSYAWDENITADESKRSASSKGSTEKFQPWSFEGKQKYQPERWLKKSSSDAGEVFDDAAGPSLPFSAGARGCFGKKLAYLELRMVITLIILNFKFEPVPQELNGDLAEELLTRKPRQCYVKLTPLL